jgi:hypothetical protein
VSQIRFGGSTLRSALSYRRNRTAHRAQARSGAHDRRRRQSERRAHTALAHTGADKRILVLARPTCTVASAEGRQKMGAASQRAHRLPGGCGSLQQAARHPKDVVVVLLDQDVVDHRVGRGPIQVPVVGYSQDKPERCSRGLKTPEKVARPRMKRVSRRPICLGSHSKSLRRAENRSVFWDMAGGSTISGPFLSDFLGGNGSVRASVSGCGGLMTDWVAGRVPNDR